jgi:hypothetical protein
VGAEAVAGDQNRPGSEEAELVYSQDSARRWPLSVTADRLLGVTSGPLRTTSACSARAVKLAARLEDPGWPARLSRALATAYAHWLRPNPRGGFEGAPFGIAAPAGGPPPESQRERFEATRSAGGLFWI